MTTREQAHKLLDELPESEIEPVVDFIASRGAAAAESGATTDEWGDLDAFSAALTTDTLRQLDDEERSAGFPPWQP